VQFGSIVTFFERWNLDRSDTQIVKKAARVFQTKGEEAMMTYLRKQGRTHPTLADKARALGQEKQGRILQVVERQGATG